MEVIIPIAVILVTLAMSITLHEFMHGYVAFKLGDNTAKYSGRLTLNPLKHIDPFMTVALPILLFFVGLPPFGAAKPVPFNPSNLRNGETGLAMVALAGPLTNLVLAAIAGIFMQLFSLNLLVFNAMQLFVLVNLAFFVFNMIPFPPLDGSRLLYVLAPDAVRRVMQTIESTGLVGVAIFIFVGFPFISPVMIQAIAVLSEWLTGTNVLF